MGRSDIPPPTTTCLKRCRSEDPSSLAELCSPPPPKQPFPHSPHLHLSILQDLESSLNAAPHNETAPTPEELVTEMMQSLKKVMGDIGELIAAPSVPRTCAVIDLDPYNPCGTTPTCNSPQAQAAHLCIAENLAACSGFGMAASMEITDHNLLRGVTAEYEGCEGDVPQPDMSRVTISLDDDCRGAALNCDEVEACRGEIKTERENVHVCVDLDSLHEDGICDAGRAAELMADITEQNDGQWNLLEDFTDELIAASALSNNHIDWLEEGCDLPAFPLAQIEEEGLLAHATDNTELLLLDCYL